MAMAQTEKPTPSLPMNGAAYLESLRKGWEAISSEFGGCHELSERNYASPLESIKVETYLSAQVSGDQDYLAQMVVRLS